MMVIIKFTRQDRLVVFGADVGVGEGAGEGPAIGKINEGDGDFADAEGGAGGPDPELEGEGVARFGEAQLGQGANAISLEAAKGVGEMKREIYIEEGGEIFVEGDAIGGRGSGRGKIFYEVAGTADDIGVVAGDFFEETGQEVGVMLMVGIKGDDPVKTSLGGETKGVDEALAITEIGGMDNAVEMVLTDEKRAGAIGAAIVDNEDVGQVAADTAEDVR